MNPYEILNVARDASDEVLKRAYRKLAKQFHPDMFHTDEEIKIAEEKFKELNKAWELIGTPQARAIYDAENPVIINIYDFYASKKSSYQNTDNNSTEELEYEKQKRAILQFLNVEFEHADEIFDMYAELATGAYEYAFSEEEYIEMLNLIIEEQNDCISNIQEIIKIVQEKNIPELDSIIFKAQSVIEELSEKSSQIPKTLEDAHYLEETRLLNEKINSYMLTFPKRIKFIKSFDILSKTWEFKSDKHFKSTCTSFKNKCKSLLNDINWVEKTAKERNIELTPICLGNPKSIYEFERKEITFEESKVIVEKAASVPNLTLQQLKEKFWDEVCEYSTASDGKRILYKAIPVTGDYIKGNFICPSDIDGIASNCFYWGENLTSITIPEKFITNDSDIEFQHSNKLKTIILEFNSHSQVVDISSIKPNYIKRIDNYICICSKWCDSSKCFAFVDENNIFIYDNKKLCQLNNVKNIKELSETNNLWKFSLWENFQSQIHIWAQLTGKLTDASIMNFLQPTEEAVKKWLSLDTKNFYEKLSKLSNDNNLRTKLLRLYIGLGALNDNVSHYQAEYLISKLDVSKMYRSRLERYPKENTLGKDPMLLVPKEAVDFVEENINNKEFHPYVFAFLEGYKFFQVEAKKANVKLSTEFIIERATQYIFHRKSNWTKEFAKQILKEEKNIYPPRVAEQILYMKTLEYNQLQNGIKKNIIETIDSNTSSDMHYKYINLDSLESYLLFKQDFFSKSFYRVEVENIFLSNNYHAIEILNDENERIAIAILILLDKGELFADIYNCIGYETSTLEVIRRALLDQEKCNTLVTGTSIGTNEDPRTSRHNWLRSCTEYSDSDWLKNIEFIKFEYLFLNLFLGHSYKGYRVRFKVSGQLQKLNKPNPYDNPKTREYRRRLDGHYNY